MAGIGFVATDTRDAEIVAYEFGQRALRVKLKVGRRPKSGPTTWGSSFGRATRATQASWCAERGLEHAEDAGSRHDAGDTPDRIYTGGPPTKVKTMAAYLVVDTLLDNPELYEQYKLKAKPLLEQYGGEYLARGGALTLKESALWSPTRLVLVKFPDVATANRFYESPEYQEILKISQQSARRTVVIVEGV